MLISEAVARRRTFLWLALVVVVIGVPIGAARAQDADVAAADAAKIRAVIEAQLSAFAADDAQRAFSYAAPPIRRQFESPERFIAMVRAGYPVVYRPASVAFFAPETVAGQTIQRVRMTDAAGGTWIALYLMQRQSDDRWLIGGCELIATTDRAT